MSAPLPAGFELAVDADTRQVDPRTLFGRSPARVLRLTGAGVAAWEKLQHAPVGTRSEGVLARRLTDAGLAHPRPPATIEPVAVTVVIPVRDRIEMLDHCLSAIENTHPVLVVDDGSRQPHELAEVVARHGARLLRRDANGGPAAARNSALVEVATEFVAFLDSDCVAPADWIQTLGAHFADPAVGAVAPRVVAQPASGSASRYAAAYGSLDLGSREARVVPATRVAYVPTAALMVRREALDQIAQENPGGGVFDPALRYGEDVDLVWRLHEAGWRIRYEPAVEVGHHEPSTWVALLMRRFHYGTSAAPLTLRHPNSMRPLVLHAGPAATVLALLARRPLLAAAAFTGYLVTLHPNLRRAGVPTDGLLAASLDAVRQTWVGLGRYLSQFATPLLFAVALGRGGRRPWRRRAAALSLMLAPALTPARARGTGPLTRLLGRLADDVAYGAGVWRGCATHRTLRPIRPAFVVRPLRITTVTTAAVSSESRGPER